MRLTEEGISEVEAFFLIDKILKKTNLVLSPSAILWVSLWMSWIMVLILVFFLL